ncbi:hypothetical protein TPAR_01817 [Tolypocladium paradoxum]|uniref:Cytochrome b561 domain-containing protein n=1 Tax=Tolypocladium paradoxum TaxID=94208 RepID=A0A2S4L6D8_9HYPO|nr:hypothetical protein TPAR_01817 [Tolypocladium paradoxum]
MASATGMPARPPAAAQVEGIDAGETEPLLGRPGDASQPEGASIWGNLTMGTAVIAQLGAFLLLLLVWANVFQQPLIFFSGHPLLQSLAVFTLIQSVLFLQPTNTAEQKRLGQRVHAGLNLVALLLLVAGIVVIEYNKYANRGPHFHSAHAYFGVITCVLLALQYLVGFTMWATPVLYGGDERARSVWKFHRILGYVTLFALLFTIVYATNTDYNMEVLKIQWWAVLFGTGLVLVGITARIQVQKLGIRVANRPPPAE